MINLVAEYCENCLQNLYRFLQNLNFAIFCSKTMWIFVYISFETSLVIGVSLQLGTLRKKTPILSSTRIHIVLLKVNFIFMYILERKRRKCYETQASMVTSIWFHMFVHLELTDIYYDHVNFQYADLFAILYCRNVWYCK